jgi:hypothetical protein
MAKCKKLGMIAISVLACVGFILASGEIENWSNTQNGTVRINRVSAGVNSVEADSFVGDLTGDVTGDITADEATIDGKYAVVGPDATTGLMIQAGTCTNGQTITFSPVFGATPRIVGSYSEDAGADTVIEFTSTTATSTVVQAASAKTIDYIVVGTRP